jgi:hypothetical protein
MARPELFAITEFDCICSVHPWTNKTFNVTRRQLNCLMHCFPFLQGFVYTWRHGFRGRGSRVLWQQCWGLSNKNRDEGEGGGSNLRDVIYGRPLTDNRDVKIVSIGPNPGVAVCPFLNWLARNTFIWLFAHFTVLFRF